MSGSPSVLSRATDLVRERMREPPTAAIILGSGLGGLADQIESPMAIDYSEIPGFATSTASGHQGKLIGGRLGDSPVIVMAGRFHRYEGYGDEQVTFPVRLMASLGAKRLIVSNAAGGLNPAFQVGDIVILRDVVDWARRSLKKGSDPDSAEHAQGRCGDRGQTPFPRQPSPILMVDTGLIDVALRAARRSNFTAHIGVYLATLGPTYETRAEYRMMRRFGFDVVGMSTAPEVRVANQCGMKVLALSMVSNVARPDVALVADHDEVLAAGQAAAFKLQAIVHAVLAEGVYRRE